MAAAAKLVAEAVTRHMDRKSVALLRTIMVRYMERLGLQSLTWYYKGSLIFRCHLCQFLCFTVERSKQEPRPPTTYTIVPTIYLY